MHNHKHNIVLPKHHKADGTFQNIGETYKLPSWKKELAFDLTYFLMNKKAPNLAELPSHVPNWDKIYNPDPNEIVHTWIGHSTFLLQVGGYNILTDPIMGERVGPIKNIGPKRLRPTPMTVDQLPPIDVVVISHDHFDHCDTFTLRDLVKRFGDKVKFYVPLRLNKWMMKNITGLKSTNLDHLDWWHTVYAPERNETTTYVNSDRQPVTGRLELTFLPAQHWSNRTFFDLRSTLWGGWGIKFIPHDTSVRPKTIYHAGDTGYDPLLFKKIGSRWSKPNGGIDLALIPIGAYAPRYYSRCEHIDPAESYLVAMDIHARHCVAMHWGTFDLATEALLEPKIKLEQMKKIHSGHDENYFITVFPGETKVVELKEHLVLTEKSIV
ncbi:hypothetical protein AKO1_011792 [Acrasis kona]|uniref:Metallo-beta-lactamase domain-containing protein n=1 Tax=Acrasis kona TaxID=1008807 RepID=A0AAW2Z553_9EUKA